MKADKYIKKDKTISRRHFMGITAAGAVAVTFRQANLFVNEDNLQLSSWPPDALQFRVHMIGHAHIDPVWLWPWQEGISVVHSTFRSALDRMKETPGLTFISSSAQFYQWVADNDPAMLAEIKKRVDEGRWNIVGGWWVEPDLNIPCGESLVRQGLYGQRTLKKLLGRKAKVAFNPDSFGHCGSLPQIIKRQEMDYYVFMRPAPHEKTLPADIFWWEGNDGSRVLTSRIMISYADDGPVRDRVVSILSRAENQPVHNVMAFYGDGDHGGGATKENIKSIESLKTEKGAPKVFYSTPENYFYDVMKEGNKTLAIVKDELQHHARGCYTAGSDIKKGNCLAERSLITAEKVTALGTYCWGSAYPLDEITRAWKKVLFLQFHDSMAGTSLYEHFQTAAAGFGYAREVAEATWSLALQKLEWGIATEDPASEYLVAFNTHAWENSPVIEYDLTWGDDRNGSIVTDEKGNQLPHQWTAASTETDSRKKLLVKCPLPSLGYRQIRVKEGVADEIKNRVTVKGNMIENEFLRLTILNEGAVSIYDKENRSDVFTDKGGCRAVVVDDPSDTWSHDVVSFTNKIGNFSEGNIKVTEEGPLRATIRLTTKYNLSTLVTDWSLCAGSRNVAVKVSLDWHEHLKMVRFSFPLEAESPVATYEIPYGNIERKTNGEEEPGQRWIDLTGSKGSETYGLALINDAKYGYSISGNEMMLSVARSAVYAHHRPRTIDPGSEHLWMDQGIQDFRMLLVPHKGDWKNAGIPRLSEEFISQPLCIYQGIHRGTRPKSASYISVDEENINISAIKKAEEGNDLILRCVETMARPVTASFRFWFSASDFRFSFRSGEIKTLRLNPLTRIIKEVNLLEE